MVALPPYASRPTIGPSGPGDLVQVDTLDIRPVPGPIFKQFTARDVVSRWDVLELSTTASARSATAILDALAARMPFAVRALSVDNGSEFMVEFERACADRGSRPAHVAPALTQAERCVERANRTHTENFMRSPMASPCWTTSNRPCSTGRRPTTRSDPAPNIWPRSGSICNGLPLPEVGEVSVVTIPRAEAQRSVLDLFNKSHVDIVCHRCNIVAVARNPSVAPLLRVSSAEQVADAVRDELLRGEIAPGTRLRDTHLAESLGVSRNTVREGLRILAVEGLIVHNLHRGTVVAELSDEDVADVYRARIALETAGIRAASHAPDRWLWSLRTAVHDLASAVDLSAVGEADLRFHQTIVAASGSVRLDRVYRNLQAELRLTRAWAERKRGDPALMARTHGPVVDALERGDIETASSLLDMINHQGERRLREAIRVKQLVTPTVVPVWPADRGELTPTPGDDARE